MPALKNIRRNINDLITDSGTTASALAKAIGMSAPLLYGYISGKSDPGVEQLEKIAAGLGTTVRDLMDEEKPVVAAAPAERLHLECFLLLPKVHADDLSTVRDLLDGLVKKRAQASVSKSKKSSS